MPGRHVMNFVMQEQCCTGYDTGGGAGWCHAPCIAAVALVGVTRPVPAVVQVGVTPLVPAVAQVGVTRPVPAVAQVGARKQPLLCATSS